MNLSFKSILILILFTTTTHILLSGCSSEATALDPPVLISPTDGIMDISIPVVLKWNELRGADSYDLQLLDEDEQIIQEKTIDGSTEHSLTINDVHYSQIYHWKVKAWSSENEDDNQWSELWKFAIQGEPPQTGTDDGDDDSDGIPNLVESGTFHTDPAIKTLFIRPITMENGSHKYWNDFIFLFPDSRPGFADIPALTNAGIEVVVIGSDGHDYESFDKFDFDPVSTNLPCHILEIIYKKTGSSGAGIYCTAFNKKIYDTDLSRSIPVNGHTYFEFSDSNTTLINGEEVQIPLWSWSVMGYTNWGSQNDRYFKPQIFSFPIDNYFQEGAYAQINIGETPRWTNAAKVTRAESECEQYGDECTSPMNLNDNDPQPDPPYTDSPDQTVAFNKVEYHNDGKIKSFELEPGEPKPTKYSKNKVLRRVIVHEIGHALLGESSNYGHCTNPSCIMFQYTLDWEKDREFGGNTNTQSTEGNGVTNTCEHSPGGSCDIRKPGIVHNKDPE